MEVKASKYVIEEWYELERLKKGDLSKKVALIAIVVAIAYILFREVGVGIVALFLLLTAA